VRVEERAADVPSHGAPARLLWRDAAALGGAAGLIVGACGGFASFEVWMLAVVTGISFATLGWRSRREGAVWRDRFAIALQLAFLAILCGAAWDNRVPPETGLTVGAIELFGLSLILAGLALRRRAVAAMGEQFTVRLRVDPAHRLVTSGPYRIVRHPNYAGLALVAFGTATIFHSATAVLAAAIVWMPVLLMRVVQEEHALARSLGRSYEAYRKHTWCLVPGVY
jgi:protein-S-isoprenylcysteine O-methyltransferase Ste14